MTSTRSSILAKKAPKAKSKAKTKSTSKLTVKSKSLSPPPHHNDVPIASPSPSPLRYVSYPGSSSPPTKSKLPPARLPLSVLTTQAYRMERKRCAENKKKRGRKGVLGRGVKAGDGGGGGAAAVGSVALLLLERSMLKKRCVKPEIPRARAPVDERVPAGRTADWVREMRGLGMEVEEDGIDDELDELEDDVEEEEPLQSRSGSATHSRTLNAEINGNDDDDDEETDELSSDPTAWLDYSSFLFGPSPLPTPPASTSAITSAPHTAHGRSIGTPSTRQVLNIGRALEEGLKWVGWEVMLEGEGEGEDGDDGALREMGDAGEMWGLVGYEAEYGRRVSVAGAGHGEEMVIPIMFNDVLPALPFGTLGNKLNAHHLNVGKADKDNDNFQSTFLIVDVPPFANSLTTTSSTTPGWNYANPLQTVNDADERMRKMIALMRGKGKEQGIGISVALPYFLPYRWSSTSSGDGGVGTVHGARSKSKINPCKHQHQQQNHKQLPGDTIDNTSINTTILRPSSKQARSPSSWLDIRTTTGRHTLEAVVRDAFFSQAGMGVEEEGIYGVGEELEVEVRVREKTEKESGGVGRKKGGGGMISWGVEVIEEKGKKQPTHSFYIGVNQHI